MNRSKLRDPRHWDKMRAAGSVETIETAHRRVDLGGLGHLLVHLTFEAKTEIKLSAGWPMGVADLADALEADEPAPFIGRPSEVAAAITAEEDARILGVPASVTVPQAARALGAHPTTIRRRLARGTYQGTQDGSTWTITDLEIREAVARHLLEV
jgi:hypothetical protein